MKIKHSLTLAFFILTTFLANAQHKKWSWSMDYSGGMSNPVFTNTNVPLQNELKNNAKRGYCQMAALRAGYAIRENLQLSFGAGYGDMSYKNDSLGIEATTLIAKKIKGFVAPIALEQNFSNGGWLMGIGCTYFRGLKDITSYELLNNNQRQRSRESSNLKGLGYVFQIGKRFELDEKHMLNLRCIGQYYPQLIGEHENKFGFWNISLGLGLSL